MQESGFVVTNTTQLGAEVAMINKSVDTGSDLYLHRGIKFKNMKSRKSTKLQKDHKASQ